MKMLKVIGWNSFAAMFVAVTASWWKLAAICAAIVIFVIVVENLKGERFNDQ